MTDTDKAIIRRLDSIENLLNRIYKDRDVNEDTNIRIGTLTDETKQVKERIAKLEKKMSADIKDVKDEIVEVRDYTEKVAENTEEVAKLVGGE